MSCPGLGAEVDRFRLYIDGSIEDGAAGFDRLDPATDTAWALMPEAWEAEVYPGGGGRSPRLSQRPVALEAGLAGTSQTAQVGFDLGMVGQHRVEVDQ